MQATTSVEMHRRMLRIRRFEEAAADMRRRGDIIGSLHSSAGQEAAAVGACIELRDDDWMVGTHRSHGHPIAKGAPLGPLMAELLGRSTGVCRGKGGSLHLADHSAGVLGESGIVGSGMPVAVGAGLSAQVRGSGQVCLCFFGDGALPEGAAHESLNLAGVWRLPVVFVCENNLYAVTLPSSAGLAAPEIAAHASAYGMPGAAVDGQDAEAVRIAVAAAVERARSGDGPSLVEARTYRFGEHSEGLLVPGYRSEEEIAAWRDRDPIALHEQHLLSSGAVDAASLAALRDEVAAEVAAAVRFALDSPMPDAAELATDMYAEPALR